MKRMLLVIPLLAAAAACGQDATTAATPRQVMAPLLSRSMDGSERYIVVLKSGADAPALARGAGLAPRHVFRSAINGFASTLTAAQMDKLRRDPAVAYVEADAPVKLFTTQTGATWGIDRTDQRNLPLSTSYTFTSTGAGVTAYVLDTGVRKAHTQFGGRADYIPSAANGNFVGDSRTNAEDCNGHGTHVSGTIGGNTYGVAKAVSIRVGRVVNCSGGGNASMVIAGMDWITANGTRPAVVSMSLGYGNVQSVRDAAQRLINAGYVVVAAAGNGNFLGTPQNACNESPAGNVNILTVGATSKTDREASFSNYGTCVDILAPGVDVVSSWYTSNTATNTISGTSMATPHVAGVAALYLALNPTATPAQVNAAIKANGTPNVITRHSRSVTNNTPNLLLFENY